MSLKTLSPPWRRLLFWSLVPVSLGVFCLVVMVAGINLWLVHHTAPRIETSSRHCGEAKVAVVFGTASLTRSGRSNPHFSARMKTAARLIRDGQVEHLLVSGDNRHHSYNEPRAMWQALNALGVRADQMTLDFAGLSTFDTLMRARKVFKLEQAILVTQGWHLPRALLIADAAGIEALGCMAGQDSAIAGEWRLRVREWLARVATLGDIHLWQRRPRYLGPVEPVMTLKQ